MFPFLPIRVCVGLALMGKLIAKTVIGITKITLVDLSFVHVTSNISHPQSEAAKDDAEDAPMSLRDAPPLPSSPPPGAGRCDKIPLCVQVCA